MAELGGWEAHPAPTAAAPLSRAEIDVLLPLLTTRTERVTAALLDLENHPGIGILRNFPQTGTTASAWARAKETIARLWSDLDRHQAVVAAARAARSRRARLLPDDLVELTALLRGPAVDLGSDSLTGAGGPGRVSLDGLAERMDRDWQRVRDLADQVDGVVTAVRTGLGPARDALRAGLAALDPDEPDAVAGRALEESCGDLDERSVTDATSIADAAAAVAELVGAQRRWQAAVARSQALRAGWPERVEQVRLQAAEVGQVAQRARQARAEVAASILTGPLPDLPDRSAAVNALVTAVERATGWPARQAAFAAAERGAADALAAARADEELAAGLLRRRAELRGRLGAFRAKATRVGRQALPEVERAYRAAADALAAVPCDLAGATRLVAAYQDLAAEPRRSA